MLSSLTGILREVTETKEKNMNILQASILMLSIAIILIGIVTIWHDYKLRKLNVGLVKLLAELAKKQSKL